MWVEHDGLVQPDDGTLGDGHDRDLGHHRHERGDHVEHPDLRPGGGYTSERTALATYKAIISALGEDIPFTNVAAAEQLHAGSIEMVARARGVALPTGPFTAAATPSTKTAACQLGVTVERQNIAMYDTLIPEVQAYPDVAKVFTTLQSASRDSHLPAFEKCS